MTSGSAEQDLIRRVLDGDGSAYETLLRSLEPMLRRFLQGLIRTRPEVDLDEVLQEVRIYLFSRLDRYNPEYPLDVFARGLARNVAKRFVYRRSDLAPAPAVDDDESWSQDLSPMEMQDLPRSFRLAMGEGRFEAPDGPPPPSREFLEMFEVFLRWGGYPHQQIAFGFSILIWGREKREQRSPGAASFAKVPVTGDPDRVVSEIGPRALNDASADMRSDVRESLRLDETYLRRVWNPVVFRLRLTGDELFARDKASREQFDGLTDRIVGETVLRDYFGKDERKSVADWTRAVKERVKRVLLDPASAARIPLPLAEVPVTGGARPYSE